jgi:hypothetical protein
MRWTYKCPKEGDVREKNRFLFLPLYINGQWRWLEDVIIEQKYYVGAYRTDPIGWVNMKFKD